jgi:hypothetical protein
METLRSSSSSSAWTYAEIFVHDGDRTLKPTHICSNEIIFRDPPERLSAEIRVCVKNGDRQTMRIARVLPHEPGSARVPIELISPQEEAATKLIA